MENNKLSSLDISIFSNFIFRSYFTIGLLNLILNISTNDSIFSLILGTIMGFLPLLIFIFLNNNLQEYNIFKKIENTFPRIIHPLLNIILIISVFLMTSYSLYNISLFVNYNLLNDIDIIYIAILLILTIIYLSSRGIKTIIRVSVIVVFIFIFISFINIISLLPYCKVSNLYPLLSNSGSHIYISCIYYMILSVCPIFLLLIIPKTEVKDKNNYKRYMLLSYIISSIYSLINLIFILSILGVKLSTILRYPEIVILQKVSLLNFIERIEAILSFKILFDLIFILALGIFYIKTGIMDTFKFKGFKKKYVFDLIIGIIILISSISLKIDNIYILIIALSVIFFIHILLMIFIKDKVTHLNQ